MIVVNKMEDVISVSIQNEDHVVPFSQEKFDKLMEISGKSQTIESMEEFKELKAEVEAICKSGEKEKVEAFHKDIFKSIKDGKYYLRIKGDIISSIPLPESLVRRLEESIDKGIDVSPLMKCWMRFLRNPKAKNSTFANKFFNYVDMLYMNPKIKKEKVDAGFSDIVAEKMAKVFQVKITNEGLINCYKVSTEVDWKYVADEDGNPVKKNLYARTFDAVTGEVTGSEKDNASVEDRIFMPAIQGTNGDAFYCEGAKTNAKGHIIRVGHTHRLESWDQVNCDDSQSCVPGLHVGGLHYINNYSGEIHNVFVDPMHIGAIPNDSSGAMRVLQYFVHSSMVAVNTSIYHSSKYAEKTEEQWEEMKKAILKEHGELADAAKADTDEIKAL